MIKLLLSALLFFFSAAAFQAQMVVDNTQTVADYVQNVLLGQNVTVSNITYNGLPANTVSLQVGSFTAPNCNMPIQSGLILSTGESNGAAGPNDATGQTTDVGFNEMGTDPDLIDLVTSNGGEDVNDWAIIEFDFVPLGDTLRFNYVFASEEYDNFVGDVLYNDVFGFFISGPGITGPYSNGAENIAVIPGTNIPVGINTLNNGDGNAGPCNYCEFYNQEFSDNFHDTNLDDPAFADSTYIQYDGYTDVLTAFAIVQCGQTYHIKLAICDGSDTSLDSGVFLQEDSFTSNIVVQVDLNFPVGGEDGNLTYEDCGQNTLVFNRPESSDPLTSIVANIEYSGAATFGVDYSPLPAQVVFDPGVFVINVPFNIAIDNTTEGSENVLMTITNIAECSGASVQSSFEFFINDTALPITIEEQSYTICSGISLNLEPQISGGYGLYHYAWNTGESTSGIDVAPALTTTYFLTVTDTCGALPASATFPVTVNQFPPISASLDPSTPQLIECGGSVNFTALANGGDGVYTYEWTDQNGNTLWPNWNSDAELTYSSWNGNGSVNLTVTDGCGLTATASVPVTLNVPPLVFTMSPTLVVPCGANYTVDAVVSGGMPSYFYNWYFNGTIDWSNFGSTYSGTANQPGTLQLSVSDNCGQTSTFNIALALDSPPILIDMPSLFEGTCTTEHLASPVVTGGSGTFNYNWTLNGNPIGFNPTVSFTSNSNATLGLSVTDACFATATSTANVIITNPPIFFDLGEDIIVSCLDTTLLEPVIDGGSGNLQYAWTIAAIDTSDAAFLEVQTFEDVYVALTVTDLCGSSFVDSLLLDLPSLPLSLLVSPDTTVCFGGSAILSAEATGGEGGFTYQWSAGSNAQTQFLDGLVSSNSYHVTATDVCGTAISDNVGVQVLILNGRITAEDMGDENYDFGGESLVPCDSCSFYWNFGDGSGDMGQNVSHTFDGALTYDVVMSIVSPIGCVDTTIYTVYPAPMFFVPTAFTPNGDGLNDVFMVVGNEVREFDLKIFNRWGDLVFYTNDPSTPWMGDNYFEQQYFVRDGVYNYTLKAVGFKNQVYEKQGTVVITR
jgi:gliding motility-associated-like protein